MLYDEVKKLLSKSKLPVKFKNEFQHRTGINIKDIAKTEIETVTALNNSINDATVILIEDNRRIFKEIENIKIDQFKELKFPFDNFFIEFNMLNPEGNSKDYMVIGLHVYPDSVIGLKSDNMYNVFMYNIKNNRADSLIPLMTILKLDKLPRFYVGCVKKCEHMINPTNLGNMINNEVCQRTERTAEYCSIAQFLLFGIKIIVYIINLINSKPKITQEQAENKIERLTKKTREVTANTNNSKVTESPGKYIYIHVEKLERFKNIRIRRDTTKHRKSPSPHTRRGHYRHLQSGKVVWVEMSYVGLKEQVKRKIYKVK